MGDEKKQSHHIFSKFQNGDIIFQTSQSSQSKAIQLATKSKYSHVGIVYIVKGDYFVFEAIQPVKTTPLQQWIDRGKRGGYVVKRLKNSDQILTDAALEKMKKVGEKHIGKNYDLTFEWSDDEIYCSELVWKVYNEALGIEVGDLQVLSAFDLTHPKVLKKIEERYGDNIPLHELVISPAAIFNSDKLKVVWKDYNR